MKVINFEQGTNEWLNWREGGITATDCTVILGVSKYKTPLQLWEEKTGKSQPEDISNNPHVRRGNRLEPVARKAIERQLDSELQVICGEHDDLSILRASFDGVDSNGIPHEIKCPSNLVFDEVSMFREESETFKMYSTQVRYQAIVADASHGWLHFYRETEDGEGELLSFKITLTAEDQALVEGAMAFWELIQSDTAPAHDPKRDVMDSNEEIDSLFEDIKERKLQIDAFKLQISQLEALNKEAQAELETCMGENMKLASSDGSVALTRFERKGTVDWNKLAKDVGIADSKIEEFRKPTTIGVKLTVK